MSITRYAETLLIRDVFTYIIPGALIMLICAGLGVNQGVAQSLLAVIKAEVGDAATVFFCLGIAYVIGYLSSTIIVYLGRLFLHHFYHSRIAPKPTKEILDCLKQVFGNWVLGADHEYLAQLCADYVECTEPEYYSLGIDRMERLSDFEAALAGVFLVWSVALSITLVGYEKLIGLIPFTCALALLASASFAYSARCRQAFTSFYIITSKENHQPTK